MMLYLHVTAATPKTHLLGLTVSLLRQGKNFVGDLLTDGKIRWVETGQIFNSPSAWATHCKRLVNPAKKSGCGWASVRYRGQKLVQYKTTWLHKYQPSADLVRQQQKCCYLFFHLQQEDDTKRLITDFLQTFYMTL